MRAIRRFLRAIALIVACGLTVPVAVVTVIMGSLLFLPLPAVLPAPKAISQSQGSKVHTVDGREIAEFKDVDLKIPVRPEDIPEVLKKAVISAEDRNFYQHGGVDVRGSFRAFWTDVNGGKVTQGGSTITQQYVKKTYTDEKRNLVRKVREAVLASQLERSIPKEEILFKYLSIVYFGGQAYGAGAAAQTYFRKPVSQLTLSEAAMMAGVIPAPSKWAPRVNMVEAEFHRQLVLKGMLEQGVVTQQEYDTALNSHLVAASAGDPPPGSTVVYPPEQTAVQYPDFVDYVQRYLFNKYGENTVLRGGLDVTVTLDTTMQDLALKSVRGMMKGTPEDRLRQGHGGRPQLRERQVREHQLRPRWVPAQARGRCEGGRDRQMLGRHHHHRRRWRSPGRILVQGVHPRCRLPEGDPTQQDVSRAAGVPDSPHPL
jgi:penicillin-binding protein 1A